MKKWMALFLAVVALATACIPALAESSGTSFHLSGVVVRPVGGNSDVKAKLKGMEIDVRIGSANGVPTVQTYILFSEDQEMETVLQLMDSRLVLCMGGISGTYTVDLEDLMAEPGQGTMMAGAMGAALVMFGANPDVVLQTAVPANDNGTHIATFELAPEQYLPTLEALVERLTEAEMLTEEELADLQQGLLSGKEPVVFEWHYNPRKGTMSLKATQAEVGFRISANAQRTTGEMEFIDTGAPEDMVDLLNMDTDAMDELSTDLEFMGIKIISFIRHSTLHKLL